MFSDISTMEFMLLVLVTLLVIGPERLPEVLRTLGLWIGRLSRSFSAMKVEIEQEIGMDDVRRQLHNESVMAQMQKIEDDVKNSIQPPDPGAISPKPNAKDAHAAPSESGDTSGAQNKS